MALIILLLNIITGDLGNDKIPHNVINEINNEIQWQDGSKYFSTEIPKYFKKTKSIKSTESTYENGVLTSHKNYDQLGRLSNSVSYHSGKVIGFETNYYDDSDQLIKCITNSGIEKYNYVSDSSVNVTYYSLNEEFKYLNKIDYKFNKSVLRSTAYAKDNKDTIMTYYYLTHNEKIDEHLVIVNSDTLRKSNYQYDSTNKLILHKFDDEFSTKYSSLEGVFQDSETTISYDSTGIVNSKYRRNFKDKNLETKTNFLFETKIQVKNGLYFAKIKFFQDGDKYKILDLAFNNKEQIVRKEYNLLTKKKKVVFDYKINYR